MKMKKTIAIILAAVIAVSAFSVMASANAMPFMNWRNGPINGMSHGVNNRTNIQSNYISLNGPVTKWGTANVSGALQAQTRTVVINATNARQGSTASAIWTTNTSRPINAFRARENFTYTFYSARLAEPSVSALNVSGNDFFMNGTWTVYQVTTSFNITTNSNGTITGFHRDQDAVALATKVYGELKVTGNWTTFSLAINGVNTLTGSVHAQRMGSRIFNPFKVNDDAGATVTSADMACVANAYGAMPGWGNYDQRMDYNLNYRIDICDLATAGANVNID
jgi:hypothetical protein